MPRRRGSPDRGTPSARQRRGAPPATRPEQADAAYKTRFRSVRFLEAGMLALLEHRERGLALRLFLRVAHLHDHRHGPDVAERILEFAIALSPELVLERHRGLRARGDGLIPELVHLLRVDVQVEGRPTCRDGATSYRHPETRPTSSRTSRRFESSHASRCRPASLDG